MTATPHGGRDLIDVHAHFVTDDYVAAARAGGHEYPDGMPAWPSWSVERQLADMDRNGIRTALLSISSPGVHFGGDDDATALAQAVNDFAESTVRAHTRRFGFFASVPLPDVDGAVREAIRAIDHLHAAGITGLPRVWLTPNLWRFVFAGKMSSCPSPTHPSSAAMSSRSPGSTKPR